MTIAARQAAPEDSETSQVKRKMDKVATEANLVQLWKLWGGKVKLGSFQLEDFFWGGQC